jgi:hypothetical protein
MPNKVDTTASCAMVDRGGELVTWRAREDGVCYTSDIPPSFNLIGVGLAACLVIIATVVILRSSRWLVSKFQRTS